MLHPRSNAPARDLTIREQLAAGFVQGMLAGGRQPFWTAADHDALIDLATTLADRLVAACNPPPVPCRITDDDDEAETILQADLGGEA